MKDIKRALAWGFTVVLFATVSVSAPAQHTIRASFESQPAGANSEFSVVLTLDPANIDVREARLAVGYHSQSGDLVSVTDNTGQPQAAVQYEVSGQFPLSGVGYADVYHRITLYTDFGDLLAPVNLARLNFKTKPSYSHPQNQFYVYVSAFHTVLGVGDHLDSLYVNNNENYVWITTSFDSLEPASSVRDWSIY